MHIRTETLHPSELDPRLESLICGIAAQGFGRTKDAMREGTLQHIRAAEAVQVAYHHRVVAGFSMYGSSLWRPRH